MNNRPSDQMYDRSPPKGATKIISAALVGAKKWDAAASHLISASDSGPKPVIS